MLKVVLRYYSGLLPLSQEISNSSLIEAFLFVEELRYSLGLQLQQLILHQVIYTLQ